MTTFSAKSLNLNSLKSIDFSSLPFLTELDLSLIDLTGLSSFLSRLNVGLKRLWLGSSVINSDLSLFNKFTNLVELDLSSIKGIVWRNETVLSSLSQLEVLKMSGLNLSSQFLENNMILCTYEKLVYLDLSNNSLTYFNVTFKHFKLDFYINLANNRLKIFDFDLFRTFYLVQLDLSFNELTNLVYNRMPNFDEAYIFLNNNGLEEIDSYLINQLLEANQLDISNNKLKMINKQQDRQISYFYPMRMKYLNLSHNDLTDIGNLFEYKSKQINLPLPITTLDLSNNRFGSLNFSFHNFIFLEILYLQKNRLTYLEEELFAPLKILTTLDISSNNLSYIKRNTFQPLFSLELLNISSNSLKFIYEDQFSALVNLIDLDLSNNSIQYLHQSTFSNLKSLKNLFIQMNRLKFIAKLDGMTVITNIYLDSYLILTNSTNVANLKESIQVKFYKKSLGISFLKSVNVISYSTAKTISLSDESMSKYCNASMFLIKYNIPLNLKTEENFDAFIANCSQFSTKYMFVESSLKI
jgi:Leucine-rich repeat (LRR) protein